MSRTTETFDTVGSHSWTVPSGVSEVDLTLLGAGAGGGDGGDGGETVCSLTVTDGETLEVYVGGSNSGRTGGFNGGGQGGTSNSHGNAAGGGGASDVRQGSDTLNDRVAVAGGGGGENSAGDGHGGEPAGLDGTERETDHHGRGGTQSAGGAGGNTSSSGSDDGQAGSFGVGGDGGDVASLNDEWPGGAGGGGYYGGGGAAGNASSTGSTSGGGGGSSYVDTGVTWDATFQTGVNEGDGSVVIEYDSVPDAPQNVTVDATGDTTIDLSWSDVAIEDNYKIYRDTSSGVPAISGNHVATVPADTTSWSDGGLDEGTTYYYVVTATNGTSESDESNEVSGTTDVPDVAGFTLTTSLGGA